MTTASISGLVSVDWLAAKLASPQLKIVDGTCYLPTEGRDARAEYRQAHIPGAVFFDVDQICAPGSSLPHTFPSAEVFANEVGKLGITENDTVICYEAGRPMGACRVWWMFRAFGHPRVAVLDGGLQRWQAGAHSVVSGDEHPRATEYKARLDSTMVCDWQRVMTAIADADALILDARSAGRFNGTAPEPRQGLRSGHMPGALNLPFDRLLTEDGGFKSATEIEQAFANAGVALDRPVITTCGSGVSAATLLMGFHLLGRTDGILYDGSWSEWGSRTDTPITID